MNLIVLYVLALIVLFSNSPMYWVNAHSRAID